jgi:hypothetical protein
MKPRSLRPNRTPPTPGILLVDGEETPTSHCDDAAEEWFAVIEAADGEETSSCYAHGTQVELILLDVTFRIVRPGTARQIAKYSAQRNSDHHNSYSKNARRR